MLEKNLDTPALPSVLIVDDRPENLTALESVLNELKIRIIKADSGEQALRAVLAQDFAVILLDVQMPGMDGFETAALIRQRERSAHTPIIFLTAVERSEERAFQGYQSGAVDYIFKPFNTEVLRAKVSVFLDLFNAQRALAKSEASLRHINATLEEMVTQRTHELVKSEAKYRQLVENIHEIFMMGKVAEDFTQGALTFISPQVESILGIHPDHFLKNPGMWVRLVHPQDSAEFADCTRRALSAEQLVMRTYRQKNARTGQYRWLEDTLLPQFDEGRRVIGYYGVVRDITERKQAEVALSARNQELAVLNSVAIELASIQTNRDLYTFIVSRIKQITGAASATFGLYDSQKQEIHVEHAELDQNLATNLMQALGGRKLTEAGFPVSDEVRLDLIQNPVKIRATLSEITFGVVSPLVGKIAQTAQGIDRFVGIAYVVDGELFGATVLGLRTGQPDPSLDMLQAFASMVAVSLRRKQAEWALRESEERFYGAFEYAAIGMALVAPDGRWMRVNRALCNIVGYTVDELLALTFQDITHPDDLETDLGYVRQILSGEIQTYQMEKRYFHKSGRHVWVLLSVSLVRDDRGKPLHFISQIQDITERKRAEEQARRHVEQMAIAGDVGRALAETLDLNEIYERLYRAVIQLLPDSDSLFISLFDPAQNVFRCAFAMSEGEWLDAAALPPAPLEPPGKGTQSEAYHTRRPVIINDLVARLSQARMVVNVGEPERVTRSGLYVPMMAKDQFIGVLITQSLMPNRYTEDDASLASLVANTAAVAIENARLYEETRRRLQNIEALRTIDHAISGSLDLRLTLGIILKQVVSQLNVDAAATLLLNPHTQTLEYAAGCGFRGKGIERSRLRLGEGHAGRAALERKTIKVADLREDEVNFTRAPLLAGEEFIAYFGAPLIAKGQVKGVLEVYLRTQPAVDDEWLEFLETLTGQVAIAVDSSGLFTDLQHANAKLFNAYDATIEGWSHALDLRDKETEGHTLRVTEMTLKLARAAGVTEVELAHVRRGALLHDIGKMGVPDSILLKPGQLTAEEWVVMRKHPIFAFELLSPIAYLRPALDIPYCHHEKWDGSGYPRGLKGEQIPLVARLFAVVDVYDALTSDRPYRPAWKKKKTLEHIRTGAGSHFDPMAVDAFIKMMESETR